MRAWAGNLFGTNPRLGRPGYWIGLSALYCLFIATLFLLPRPISSAVILVPYAVLYLGLGWITGRRFMDLDKPAWPARVAMGFLASWVAVALVNRLPTGLLLTPLLATLLASLAFGLLRGTSHENRFGPPLRVRTLDSIAELFD
jgi:uncharacterized membrane protein YhaH (DUF805 family)